MGPEVLDFFSQIDYEEAALHYYSGTRVILFRFSRDIRQDLL